MAKRGKKFGVSKRDHLLLLAFVFSGFAALGYELLWTRLLSLALGNEILGVLGVLAGFFGGMVIGTFVLGSRVVRVRNPVRFFMIMELIAAAFALISPHLLYKLSSVIPRMIGPLAGDNDTLIALVLAVFIAGAVLLPATLCIGPTLVFLVEARRRIQAKEEAQGKGVGRLYAANTLGATLGVLVSIYLLFPAVGLKYSSVILAGVGGLSALVAGWWQRYSRLPAQAQRKTPSQPDEKDTRTAGLLYFILFLTGMAGLGYEIAVIHILSQILENTVYTFANLLAFYLMGTAMGAWIYQRWYRTRDPSKESRVAVFLIGGMMVCVGLTAWQLRYAPEVADHLLQQGARYTLHMRGEFLLAGYIFLLPTAVMGALFSHLMGYRASTGLGSAYGFNTLGAALAPFVFGLLAIRALGYMLTLYLVLAMYLIIFCVYAWKFRCGVKRVMGVAVVALCVGGLLPRSMDLTTVPKGWRLVDRRDSPMGHVIVMEMIHPTRSVPFPVRILQVNKNHVMGGMYGYFDRRMGNLPLLLVGEAKHALFLGVGTGGTVGCTQHYPLQHVDAVEIIPEVVDMLPLFRAINEDIEQWDHVRIHKADARRFVRASRDQYDLIVADLFHPGRDGAGMLYTKEHFQSLREHVVSGGIVAQWVSLEQFDLESLRIVVRTFLSVFPETHAFLGANNSVQPLLLLTGKAGLNPLDKLTIDLSWLETMFQELGDRILGEPVPVFEDIPDFFGAYFTDVKGLRLFAGEGPINSDLDPILLFWAPRSAYETKHAGYQNLAHIMNFRKMWRPETVKISEQGSSELTLEILEKRWKAVKFYLEGDLVLANNAAAFEPALGRFLKAYSTDTTCGVARGRLIQLLLSRPSLMDKALGQLGEKERENLRRDINQARQTMPGW